MKKEVMKRVFLLLILMQYFGVNVYADSEANNAPAKAEVATEGDVIENTIPEDVGNPEDIASIKALFDEWKLYMGDKDRNKWQTNGTHAAGLISQASIDYFGTIRDHALYSDVDTLDKLNIVDQIHVLLFRVSIPTDELLDMQDSDVAAYALGKHFIFMHVRHADEIRELQIQGGSASAVRYLSGKAMLERYRFVKDAGQWRVDISPELESYLAYFTNTNARQLSSSVAGEAFMIVELRSGKKLESRYFEPPLKRPE